MSPTSLVGPRPPAPGTGLALRLVVDEDLVVLTRGTHPAARHALHLLMRSRSTLIGIIFSVLKTRPFLRSLS